MGMTTSFLPPDEHMLVQDCVDVWKQTARAFSPQVLGGLAPTLVLPTSATFIKRFCPIPRSGALQARREWVASYYARAKERWARALERLLEMVVALGESRPDADVPHLLLAVFEAHLIPSPSGASAPIPPTSQATSSDQASADISAATAATPNEGPALSQYLAALDSISRLDPVTPSSAASNALVVRSQSARGRFRTLQRFRDDDRSWAHALQQIDSVLEEIRCPSDAPWRPQTTRRLLKVAHEYARRPSA